MGQPRGHYRWLAVALLALCSAACGSHTPTGPSSQTQSSLFAAWPIDQIGFIDVIGTHYFASGDMRPEAEFYTQTPVQESRNVLAPADAVVTSVTSDSRTKSARVDFIHATGYRFYLTGLSSVIIQPGASVAAGQKVGTFLTSSMVRLGLIDPSRTVGFARPERYPDEILRGRNALLFFGEPVRSAILARTFDVGDETLNQDIPGTLQGLWYREGSPVANSVQPENRDSWLFFIRASPERGMRAVFRNVFNEWSEQRTETLATTDVQPATVTPATGIVTYRFPSGVGGWVTLLVQMTNATTVRIETWDSYHSPGKQDFAFTSAARTYVR